MLMSVSPTTPYSSLYYESLRDWTTFLQKSFYRFILRNMLITPRSSLAPFWSTTHIHCNPFYRSRMFSITITACGEIDFLQYPNCLLLYLYLHHCIYLFSSSRSAMVRYIQPRFQTVLFGTVYRVVKLLRNTSLSEYGRTYRVMVVFNKVILNLETNLSTRLN